VRRLLTPRWLARHALALVLIGGCLALGVWQYLRASGGNTLSWAYTLEWPLFAGFIAYMWRRWVRDDLSAARGEDPYAAERPPPIRAIRPQPAPEPPADDEDPQLAAYNRYLAWLAENPGRKPSEYPLDKTG
jgi:DNA-binding transcriptional regulator of glucitol operon